jgi:acyl-CoA synthetase (AMP-forming)/AMP-acid ligase II
MNSLLIVIIEIFKQYLESIALVSKGIEYTYKDIMEKSYSLANRLNEFSNKKLTIALVASNSAEWVIIFLAVILSNNKLVLFSPKLSKKKLLYVISNSKASILFTDLDLNQDDFPFIYQLFKIDNIIFENDKMLLHKDLVETEALIIYTPRGLKYNAIPYYNIAKTMSILDKKEIFNNCSNYVAHQEFTYNYVLTLLVPLLRGVRITIPTHNLLLNEEGNEVVILNAFQFEELWREFIESSDDVFIKFLKDFRFNKIKNWIIKRNLKRLFPNIENLIILNSSLNRYIESTLKYIKLPYTVTYGTVETCGIASYTSPKFFQEGSCGDLLFSDFNYMNNILEDDTVHITDNLTLYFENRRDEEIKTEYGFTISRDVESILKNLPLVIDCVLILYNDELKLLVNIDLEYIDSEHLRIHEVNRILDECRKQINNKVHTFEKISKIVIDLQPFKRDSYGRILREYYTIE